MWTTSSSSPPPPSPYFQPPPLSSSFSNLTIGLQKPWDRIPPLLSCHHRLLTLWRPRHHKQHNLQQKYPPTSRRRKVPQKKRPPHQPQIHRSQVSLFVSFLMLLIISGLICLWYLIPVKVWWFWHIREHETLICITKKIFLIMEFKSPLKLESKSVLWVHWINWQFPFNITDCWFMRKSILM